MRSLLLFYQSLPAEVEGGGWGGSLFVVKQSPQKTPMRMINVHFPSLSWGGSKEGGVPVRVSPRQVCARLHFGRHPDGQYSIKLLELLAAHPWQQSQPLSSLLVCENRGGLDLIFNGSEILGAHKCKN